MHELWIALTRSFLTPPETAPAPQLRNLNLPRPARLVPGAQAAWDGAVSAFNSQISTYCDELKQLVFDAGVFAGGVIYGPVGLVLGFILGWTFCRQCQKMLVEHSIRKS
jgi:hypothetical protein